jgi:very-short-patch-repair endonuclease
VVIEDFSRCDFFIPKYNLIVEVLGYCHRNGQNKLDKRTENRIEFYKKMGYSVALIDPVRFLLNKREFADQGRRFISQAINSVIAKGPQKVQVESEIASDDYSELARQEFTNETALNDLSDLENPR